MIYPYLRVWSLAEMCVRDLVLLLATGRRAVVKCLLGLRDVLLRDENRYLLNTLYVCDCVWL